MFNWLTIELTNRCNKSCWFCGRAEKRKNNELELGDMDVGLFKKIIKQYKGDILQFSRDGDPLLYENLIDIGHLSKRYFTNIVTNGILLWEKFFFLKNFDTITVSVTDRDLEQFISIKNFTFLTDKPKVLIKFVSSEKLVDWEHAYKLLGLQVMRRIIHDPQGDWEYKSGEQLIPEIGVCQDFLMKPSINWKGEFFICNRFDPEKKGKIGDVTKQTLEEIWNSEERARMLDAHRRGKRSEVELCKNCEFWGIPRYC